MENIRFLRRVMTQSVMLLFMFSLLGCGGDDDSPVESSSGSQSSSGSSQTEEETEIETVPTITVSTTDVEISVEGGSFTLTVTANVDYSVSVDADWLTFTSDGDTYTFTVEASESTEERTATITVTGEGVTKEVTVTQEAAYIEVSSEEVTFAAKGETVNLTVTANVEYEVSTDADWLSLESDTGNSILSITAAANESTESRSAVVAIESNTCSVTVNVTQEGGYLTYSGETAFSFSPESNTIELSLQTNVDYTVSTSASWVSLSSTTTSGTDTELLTFDVDTNDSTEGRNATINVAWGETVYEITVTQEGAYLEVSQTEFTVSTEGGTFSFTVSSNVEYSVAVDSSWLTYTKNSDTLSFTVEESTDSETRSATITLSWNSLTCTIKVSQNGYAGTNGSIDEMPKVTL